MLELEDDCGKIHNEKFVREWSGHVHNRLDSFPKGGWNLPRDLCAQLKHDSFTVDNLSKGENYRKYEFKRRHQTKLVPTSECYGLEVLEAVNTSDGWSKQDDFLPDLCSDHLERSSLLSNTDLIEMSGLGHPTRP